MLAAASNKPTNTVLATTTITNASVTADHETTLPASFSGPQLVAGTPYAVAISRPGGSQFTVRSTLSDICGGDLLVQDPIGTGPFNSIGSNFNLITEVIVQ